VGGSAPGQAWATLAEAIAGIRAELDEAMATGAGERLKFDVGPVELEFAVDVQRDAQAKAGVKVWVVEIGGSGGMSRNASHRIKVTLNPVDTVTGASARVGDQVEGLPPRPGPG
jgi:carbon monoxide dehydrogenase subunit G